MFFHNKGLQFEASPDKPDAIYARRLQEVLGGQWGEVSVAMSYLLQGWSAHMPGKYKDMLLDIGTEELAHIEMLSVMIGRLLEGAPIEAQMAAVNGDAAVAAVMGGANPQHAIVTGLGAKLQDSNGNPWSGNFAHASGSLMADFHYNVTAEMNGRLQATRLYNMTDDAGVRKMLSFMIARDTMHQNQWLAAIEQLKEDGLEGLPVPSDFPSPRRTRPSATSSGTCRPVPSPPRAGGPRVPAPTATASSPTWRTPARPPASPSRRRRTSACS